VSPTNSGSLQFAGTGRAVAVGYKGVTGTTARSIGFWIKTTAREGTICYWGSNLGSGQLTNGEQVKIQLMSGGGVPIHSGAGRTTHAVLQGQGSWRESAQNIGDDHWHHVCFTWAGGDNTFAAANCYVDGTLSNTPKDLYPSGNINTPAERDLTLGAEPSDEFGHTEFVNCYLDDFVIFDTDIGPAGAAQLANNGLGNIDISASGIHASNLQIWYRMEPATDTAGAGGTILNAAISGTWNATTTAGTSISGFPGPVGYP
jgi:hypothetical protein